MQFPHPVPPSERPQFFQDARIDPQAHSFAGLVLDFLELLGRFGLWLLDVRDWLRQSRTRRRWAYGLTAAIAALMVIGITGLPTSNVPVITETNKEPPASPTTVEKSTHFTYTAEDGDTRSTIAAEYGTTEEQIFTDNREVFAQNAAWCRSRPVTEAYLKGYMPNGIMKRNGVFCVLTKEDGVEYAKDTLRSKKNHLRIPCSAATSHVAACSQDAIAAK